jgi:adenylosuccinate synthase
VAAKYATDVNGLTALAITKLDVLTGIDPLKLCIAYEIDGRETTVFPDTAARLARAIPVYEEMPGWSGSLSNARRLDDLPMQALRYVERLAELSECPVALISIGAGREETIAEFGRIDSVSGRS